MNGFEQSNMGRIAHNLLWLKAMSHIFVGKWECYTQKLSKINLRFQFSLYYIFKNLETAQS